MQPEEIQAKINRVKPHFPHLDFDRVTVNEEGLTHRVLIVDRERVFRFPVDDRARQSLRQELAVLDLLRPVFPARLPAYDFVAEDVASYPFLEGTAFTRSRWLRCGDDVRRRLAGHVGHMLAAMHAIRPDTPGLDQAAIGPSLTVRTQERWENLYQEIQTVLYPGLMAHAREGVDELFSHVVGRPAFMAADPVLMNGDIGTYHILFDEEREEICAVLDFGTAGWGDPACDLACLLYQYGETFIRLMSDTYPAAGELIDRARFWAGTLELQWVLGGLKSLEGIDLHRQVASWSWLTVHLGFGAKDSGPIGSPL